MVNLQLLFLLVVTLQAVGVAAWNVVMRPDHVGVSWVPETVTFTCNADSALARCQFRWWDWETKAAGPLLDLSRGLQSQADPAHLNRSLTGYSYTGRGLGAGDCGVSLQVKGYKHWVVGCRVRAEEGSWKYAWANMIANYGDPLPFNLTTPRVVVVHPGGEARVSVKAQEPLSGCDFELPSVSGPLPLYFHQGAASRNSTGRHRYLGAGLESGECGLRMTNISEADNGLVGVYIYTQGGKNGLWQVPFIVTRPPTAPTLNLTYSGDNVTATCEVGGSRPVASIAWILGHSTIRQDDVDDSSDVWRWPWMEASIKQTLKLHPQDNGKVLRCEVSHVSIKHLLVAQEVISFTATPAQQQIVLPGLPVSADIPLLAEERVSFIAPLPPITCPPLTSESVLLTCSVATPTGRERGSCSQPQEIGSEASLACKPGFAVRDDDFHRKITCLRSGMWNRPIITCIPDCGRRNINGIVPLVAGGKVAKKGEFPWHVGIYETMPGRPTETPKLICGGTLISLKVVLTAAHCMWNKSDVIKKDARNFKVAAGKHLRVWDDPNPGVQKRNVSEIVVHELFCGSVTDFYHDIGFLRLGSPFETTASVNLVCMDWDNFLERQQLRTGSVGVVAGWGFTEAGELSDSLKYVKLPFVDPVTCLDSLPSVNKKAFTPDKICAGFVNRSTSVCRGDSGGGLVFIHPGTNKYYLRGIVSITFQLGTETPGCYSQHYTAFTRVSRFIAWMQENI